MHSQTLTDSNITIPTRIQNGHKGTFGKLLILAGSNQYPGSAFLCAKAAYRSGVGLVTLCIPQDIFTLYPPTLHEVTYITLDKTVSTDDNARHIITTLDKYSAMLLGPGLGSGSYTKDLVIHVLQYAKAQHIDKTFVIDADGLNALASINEWWNLLPKNTILTPHIGEMKRLCKISIPTNLEEIVVFAEKMSKIWSTTLVLKQSQTIIASPDHPTSINTYQNPLLATAGTGDVLAGMIASFVAQGLKPFAAACTGVYIHSKAGKMLENMYYDQGMMASDLIEQIPYAIASITAGKESVNLS